MTNTSQFDLPQVTRLPPWFRQEIPDIKNIESMKSMFRGSGLHTVCESARCPNLGQCWSKGTATFMILGDICTRACRFCAVPAGRPLDVDPHEPVNIAQTIRKMNLNYVVITSVARDDLKDEGAAHFAQTIVEVRKLNPKVKIEVLIPDFSSRSELLTAITQAAPEVISHNLETVKRLSPSVRPQAIYERSLQVLREIKKLAPSILVKSSFMVGLGETLEEIIVLMKDLLAHDCEILTIGQYLAPTQMKRHVRVQRFVTPEEFERFRQIGMDLGFKHVMSGPLVRSSYIAEEGYQDAMKFIQGAKNQLQ